MNIRVTATLVMCSLGGLVAGAGESGKQAKKPNPLAKLPSKPVGEHVAKLKALGDNSWVNLGQAGACDRFPRKTFARGRAWAGNMTFAPDLGGAFFCGTGSHGSMPNGYYMDDLWFYDANAHKWICLYPGATRKTQLKLDEHGFEVTLDGVQNPVSYLSHAYSNITYVDHLKKYMLIHRPCPWWTKALPQRPKWLGIPDGAKLSYNYGKLNKNCRHPIYWDVQKNQWQRTFVKKKGGPEKSYCGILEYVPSMKKALNITHGKLWWYDFDKEEWTASGIKGGPRGYDSNTCMDRKSNMLYVSYVKTFHVLDIKAGKWTKLSMAGGPASLGNTNGHVLTFDSVNNVVLYTNRSGHIWIYDVKAGKWLDMGQKPPKISWKRYNPKYMLAHGFYSPDLNVHYIYRAGDSGNNDATMLAYRYKKAGKGANKPTPKTSAAKPVSKKKPAAVVAAPKPMRRKRTPQQICAGWFSAARNYKGIGKQADAKRCLNEIVRAYPKSEWATRARREMDQL